VAILWWLSAEWRAEWRERLGRFRGWTGTSGDFCRQEGISRSSLLRWARRLRVPARSQPGPGLARVRAKLEADRSPFAAVRIRPVPASAGEPVLRVVLANGALLGVPGPPPGEVAGGLFIGDNLFGPKAGATLC
jgi:hypothetical protein